MSSSFNFCSLGLIATTLSFCVSVSASALFLADASAALFLADASAALCLAAAVFFSIFKNPFFNLSFFSFFAFDNN